MPNMFIVAMVSAGGGVGKTTLVANLAPVMGSLGYSVVAVEWDPANVLAFHLGLPFRPPEGWVELAAAGGTWGECAFRNSEHVDFLPFGEMSDRDRATFERKLLRSENWLRQRLGQFKRPFKRPDNRVVLIDVQRGPSVYLTQALRAADLVLAVVAPRPTFLLEIQAIDQCCHSLAVPGGGRPRPVFLLNQVDTTRRLSSDIVVMARAHLDERLLHQAVHRDEAVPEAAACNLSLLDYEAESQGGYDMKALAAWLSAECAAAADRLRS